MKEPKPTTLPGFSLVETTIALGIIAFVLITILGLVPALNQNVRQSSQMRWVSSAVAEFESVLDSRTGDLLRQALEESGEQYIHHYTLRSESDRISVLRLWSAPGEAPDPANDAAQAAPSAELPNQYYTDGRILRFHLQRSPTLEDATDGAAVDVSVFSIEEPLATRETAELRDGARVFSYTTVLLPR